jgi:hypothetical protein
MKQFTNLLFVITLLISSRSIGQTDNSKEQIITAANLTQADSIGFQETPKKLSDIVARIAKINEVQSAHIGFAGVKSDNYSNFLELKKIATTDDLLILTDNRNAVVACYAGLALADRSFPDLKTIFLKFLRQKRAVTTINGCTISKDDISNELYHRYWNNVADKAKVNDKLLLQLDSIILYNDYSHWLLMVRAFKNRIYPASHKNRIEELAFKHDNREALFYLCTWYRADHYVNIKQSLITYLKKTDFKKTGISDYYRTLDELLKFKDSEIETIIVQKLKKDKHWKHEEQRFISLLGDYSIYENFD